MCMCVLQALEFASILGDDRGASWKLTRFITKSECTGRKEASVRFIFADKID